MKAKRQTTKKISGTRRTRAGSARAARSLAAGSPARADGPAKTHRKQPRVATDSPNGTSSVKSTAAARRKAKAPPAGRMPWLAPERIRGILDGLARSYPTAHCALVHRSAWELLVATILSAQCTDVRVNIVTPELFRRHPTIADFAALAPEELEPEIRSTGFFRNKAKAITASARKIMADYGGAVPDKIEELLTLPGVARKTANVVLGVWFNQATGIVVDTHVQRIAQRLELTKETAAEKIEQDLMRVIPRGDWIVFSHRMIWHGRKTCVARRPHCAECSIERFCYSKDKTFSTV
jgi:endonuclease-3